MSEGIYGHAQWERDGSEASLPIFNARMQMTCLILLYMAGRVLSTCANISRNMLTEFYRYASLCCVLKYEL
jgi:hypothetical protein